MEGLTRGSFPLTSLEFHSNLISDAVKKVIKVGKVSVEQPALSRVCSCVSVRGSELFCVLPDGQVGLSDLLTSSQLRVLCVCSCGCSQLQSALLRLSRGLLLLPVALLAGLGKVWQGWGDIRQPLSCVPPRWGLWQGA